MDGATRRAGVGGRGPRRAPPDRAGARGPRPHAPRHDRGADGARALAEEARARDRRRRLVPHRPAEPAGHRPGDGGRSAAPRRHAAPSSPHGTVGAVALDADGRLASATSTGGRKEQLDGRVGDCPLIGAGTYADGACAVSATGDGEELIRASPAHHVATLVRDDGRRGRRRLRRRPSDVRALGGTAGLIAVDREGTVALRFTTEAMARGFMRAGRRAVRRRRA